jgi:translation initiation factor IF-2
VPIRIYSLAKELGIENKDLVDICAKVGIHGKGSALASLTDEEVDKVKSHLSGGGKAEAPKKVAETPAPQAAKPEKPVSPVSPVSPATPTPTPTPAASEPGSRRSPQKDDMFNRHRGPLRDLTARAKSRSDGDDKDKGRSAQSRRDAARGRPNVRVAAMPDVQQPVPSAPKNEEKVQKPDIALPQDAIRKAKQGGGVAPLQQFTETSKTKVDKKKKEKAKVGRAGESDDDRPLSGRGRKRRDAEPAGESPLGNTREARTASRTKRRNAPAEGGASQPYRSPFRQQRRQRRGKVANTAAPRKDAVVLELPCTVREFSEAAGIGAGQVLRALMEMGTMSNINGMLDDETAQFLAAQMSLELEFKQPVSLEDQMLADFEGEEEDEEAMELRPPIVTFLGHVDHGKTSLLDKIIDIDVVSGEAGGITQHIRAYAVEKDGRKIAFVDTPGHEAFTEMRARGANVTDIAVLVVAADDGVMPQTEEAISHAKAAEVPIVVALNKCDLPGANPDKVLQDLAAHELLPSEWGGDVEVIRTSAITGEGIDDLLEMLLATAELYELKANPEAAATGVCLEAEQESDRGVIAKIMVQRGTLRVGDVVVCGNAHGRVKAMYDTLRPNVRLEEAGPSTPVNLTGLDRAPGAGDRFYVLDDIAKAREIAETRDFSSREISLSGVTTKVSLEEFQQRLESGTLGQTEEVVTLNLIIRADTRGSIEAIQKELGKISHPEVEIRILQASVGGVSVADVTLAQASSAVIIAFNVVPDETARSLADERQVEVRRYDIIYKVTDDIRATLEGKLKPEEQKVDTGTAMVLRTFSVSRTGTIAGCRVMRGAIERDNRIRVIRENRVIGDYAIESLRREKDDVKEVRQGMECGIKLANYNDIKEADTLESYKVEQVARTLD